MRPAKYPDLPDRADDARQTANSDRVLSLDDRFESPTILVAADDTAMMRCMAFPSQNREFHMFYRRQLVRYDDRHLVVGWRRQPIHNAADRRSVVLQGP